MKIKLSAICFFAFLLAHTSYSQTTVIDSFLHDGLMRNFRIYVPAIYNSSTPVPLVFNLHGYTSNAFQQELYGDFRPVADTANFILVHPNGTVDGTGTTFWNAFGGSSVDDVGFISALIDSVSTWYAIDADAVYSTGMSNGGFMSYSLACFLSNKIAAVASVTGSMVPAIRNACSPIHPVPVMEIHGTADPTVPYLGGSGFLPVETVVRHWAAINHCNLTPSITQVPNINLLDGCTAERQVFSGGDNGSTVEHYKIIGGAHTWPGAPFVIGVTNMDINASLEIWKFFRKYRMNMLTSANLENEKQKISLFPNPSNGNFTISFGNNAPKTVSVINSLGQEINHFEVSSNEMQMKIEGKGIYFVRVDGMVMKVMVE